MPVPHKIKHKPYLHRGRAFLCPQCNEYPSVNHALLIKAVRALYIPYFLCSECRLAHINTDLVRAKVRDWWKDRGGGPLSGSLAYWQKYILLHMRELERHYTDQIGYRFLKNFKRVRPHITN